jgi:SecD/SecF fusion protein
MRNKGAIKLVAILMALVCIYQLSFTVVTSRIEKKARDYATGLAKGDADKVTALKAYYKDSLAGEPVYNFLGLKKYTYRECQEREFNLGLDLKGGMNVMLEVSVNDLVLSLANNSSDNTFKTAMRLARERQVAGSQDDFVTLFGNAFNETDPNAKLAAIFNTIELRDRIKYNSTNEEVLNVLREETKIAIANSVRILRTRIDQFGVAQPNFQELGTAGRVMIELPGIKDPERVRKLLQVAAKLEFWETYENSEVYGFMNDANTRLRELNTAALTTVNDTTATPAATETAAADTTKTSLLDKIEKDTTKASADQSLEEFKKDNPLFFILRPNADNNGTLQQGPVVGYAHFRDTAKVNAVFANPQIRSIFPTTMKFFWTSNPIDGNDEMYALLAIKVSNREGAPALDGAMVVNARSDFGGTSNQPEVSLSMNAEGAKIWQRLTKENVGKSIAIVLDNYIRSYPTVNGEIAGGRSSISGGGMTIEEAQDLANILNVGRMDAPAKITQEEVVGPSLGQESVNSGLASFALAFLLVLLYMGFYYSRAGWVANIALVINVFFLVGVLASLGAVLTLPGIAGIVLTLGMAVDANVIIYERIREELRAGKGIKLAVKEGYKHAMSAIIDGNVTTLLTGIILYVFGSGPIRGFATTLVIGILTSLFTAIFISRIIFERIMDKDRKLVFGNKYTNDFMHNVDLKFLDKRKIFYIVSGVLMTLAVISLVTRGLNMGVDFTGGRTYIVQFAQPVNTQDLVKTIGTAFDGEQPQITTFGTPDRVKITTKFMIKSDASDVSAQIDQKLYEGCKTYLPQGTDFNTFNTVNKQSSQLVGPTVASDIVRAAILAIIFALLGIFLYIFVRFRNWHFGLGGVAALFHDTVIVLGVYSALYSIMPFSMEVDQAFIAAILTIIGYSINDTVIVFDRVREFTTLFRKRDRKEIISHSINSTLGRTLNTAGTTLVVLIAIFLFGGASIRGFVFALLFGIAFGTYSSIFIASALVYDLHLWQEKRALKKQQLTK